MLISFSQHFVTSSSSLHGGRFVLQTLQAAATNTPTCALAKQTVIKKQGLYWCYQIHTEEKNNNNIRPVNARGCTLVVNE